MTVEIAKVREAEFYLKADLEWLNRQINDERAQGFQAWVDKLDFGCPKNLLADVTAYQAQYQGYLDGLKALRDKLQAELDGIEATISGTKVPVTEEVQRYLRKEEVKEPDEPITKG